MGPGQALPCRFLTIPITPPPAASAGPRDVAPGDTHTAPHRPPWRRHTSRTAPARHGRGRGTPRDARRSRRGHAPPWRHTSGTARRGALRHGAQRHRGDGARHSGHSGCAPARARLHTSGTFRQRRALLLQHRGGAALLAHDAADGGGGQHGARSRAGRIALPVLSRCSRIALRPASGSGEPIGSPHCDHRACSPTWSHASATPSRAAVIRWPSSCGAVVMMMLVMAVSSYQSRATSRG